MQMERRLYRATGRVNSLDKKGAGGGGAEGRGKGEGGRGKGEGGRGKGFGLLISCPFLLYISLLETT